MYAKEGSLSAAWTEEWATASKVAIVSDATNGPLIAVIDASGNVWAKQGSLTTPWVEEYSGASDAATAVSVAVIPRMVP